MILMTFSRLQQHLPEHTRVACLLQNSLTGLMELDEVHEGLAGVYDGVGVACARDALQQQRDDVGIAQYVVELRGVAGHVMQAK